MDPNFGLPSYPDKFFDLAIVDPPYGIGASAPTDKPRQVKQANGEMLSVPKRSYGKKGWDKTTPDKSYFDELFRVSKNQIIWGENYYNIPLPGGRLVWDKINGECHQYGCEIAYLSMTDRTDVVYYLWSGMIQGLTCSKDVRKALVQQGDKSKNEKRIHPTQKPVALYKWILEHYAKPGDLILDTHTGSASSLIAFEELGFNYHAFELDADYYADAKKRMAKGIQTNLFANKI